MSRKLPHEVRSSGDHRSLNDLAGIIYEPRVLSLTNWTLTVLHMILDVLMNLT